MAALTAVWSVVVWAGFAEVEVAQVASEAVDAGVEMETAAEEKAVVMTVEAGVVM